jgi:hypothetical protein
MMNTDPTRRKLLKTASVAFALLPIFALTKPVRAMTNAEVRGQLKYQNTPKENMSCASCLEFIPGKTGKDLGGCKVIPGDDEISPNGYCTRWNTM